MAPVVVGLLLVSAVLHAAWNVLLKTSGDPLRTSGVAIAASGFVFVPAVFVAWLAVGRPAVRPDAMAIAVVSGVLEAAYFVLLSAAYRRGAISLVYPIARGTAPMLAVLAGVLVLGERLEPLAAIGVGCLLAGLLALQRPWRFLGGDRAHATAAGFAVATGFLIATYSAFDRVGSRLTEPWLYAGILWAVTMVALVGWIAAVDREAIRDILAGRHSLGRATLAGLGSLTAYLLVLVAYTLAPLTVVAPLRESAIVLASGWGALRLGEVAGRRAVAGRLGAAVVVAVGVGLIAFGR